MSTSASASVFRHKPVLLYELVDALRVHEGGVYLDGTLGGGGHTAEIVRRGGRVIGVDRDTDAIAAASAILPPDMITLVHGNFMNAPALLDELGVETVDGAILDLGVSSHQFDTPSRGFSYRHDAPLDMRMDPTSDITARDLVNHCSQAELEKILFHYGEESNAKRIVARIIAARADKPIDTTFELVEIIKSALPPWHKTGGKHPAGRTFQAIRIAVNDELTGLADAIDAIAARIVTGGRFGVITFHSLEDRIVKTRFSHLCTDCICPSDFPVCNCDKRADALPITKKPITPTLDELRDNSRSSSAKLRVIERI